MIYTQHLPLSLIDETRRLRKVKPAWAAVMADDIARGVELPAILVRPATPDEVADGCFYELVAGAHRLEAHRLAGRTEIRADVEEMSRAEARIHPITRDFTYLSALLPAAQIKLLDDFLLGRKGYLPFTFTPPYETAPRQFTCEAWDASHDKPVLTRLKATFQENFDP